MKIVLATPHGFCAGVVRAIDTLECALEIHDAPLYVYHEIVHNKHVVDDFEQRGVVFVDSVDEVPDGALLLFSAHGVSPAVRERAAQRLQTIDATCPLVAKVHNEAVSFAKQGYSIILIGHAGHDEVVGTMGEAPEQIRLVQTSEEAEQITVPNPARIAYLTQTTLSSDDAAAIVRVLERRFPNIQGPRTQDICYATQNRQEAVRNLAGEADVVLVIGSANSSNSIRLVEVSQECGTSAHLIDQIDQIDTRWLENAKIVVVTAGASAPEHLVWTCIHWLQEHYGAEFEERRFRDERVSFRLPNLFPDNVIPASDLKSPAASAAFDV
jgi:4-hydroxy-3-methylbut-2-enyl diphosphate reductase